MLVSVRSALIACVFLLLGAAPAWSQATADLPEGVEPMTFGVDTMTITTANGRFVYDIEVATTPQQQARGLMYRTSLGVNKGMLFIFPREQMQAFWMANTLIPLDMVFIDAEARLISIQREAEPLSRTSRPSEGPARFVLEIDGGEAAVLGIDADTLFEFGPRTIDYLQRLDASLGN
jgi:uncharacterized membrane protein (UPF0127 family)